MSLKKIQNAFLWKNYTPKLKHETLCIDYKGGGLKNIDISNKIISLTMSQEWRLIPFYLITKFFSSSFKFH